MVKHPVSFRVKRFISNFKAEICGVFVLLMVISHEAIAELVDIPNDEARQGFTLGPNKVDS